MVWSTLLLIIAHPDVLQTTCGELKHWYHNAGSQSCCKKQGGRPTDELNIPVPQTEYAQITFKKSNEFRSTFENIDVGTIDHVVQWDIKNKTANVFIDDIFAVDTYLSRIKAVDESLFLNPEPILSIFLKTSRKIEFLDSVFPAAFFRI